MELEVLVLAALVATARGIIVDQSPLAYGLTGGYAAQYPLQNVIYKYGNPNQIPYSKSPQQSKYSEGSQYAAGYPVVHHPAEYTFASPPVRHAEPIDYPVPPAPVREDVKEPQPLQLPYYQPVLTTYTAPAETVSYQVPQDGLLGVAYSPASDVSRMSYSNGYGVSYGY